MNDCEVFFNLFVKRLFLPLKFIWEKIYKFFPSSIKKYLRLSNLQIFIVCSLFLILLASYCWPRDNIMKTKIDTARWPLSTKKHLQMSTIFFQTGDLTKARIEIAKAKKLYQLNKLFDFKKHLKKQLEQEVILLKQPVKIKQEITYWQNILQTKPNFKNAYLHLSFLYYQTYQDKEAQKFWKKAFYLDPNNKIIQQLGKNFKIESN